MKIKRLYKIIFVATILCAEMAFKLADVTLLKKQVTGASGFAVVELFTSEGCSSCPPADVQIAQLQKEERNMPVYILAYHVDYWNRLGWKDAFSSAKFSQRQQQYSKWLNSEVYTPQAIVNGKKEFVGSKGGTLRNEVKAGLSANTKAQLAISQLTFNTGIVSLNYELSDTPPTSSLVLALVQPDASSEVKAGENAGRKLNHVQIVRNLETVNLHGKNSGAAQIKVPAGVPVKGLEVIAFAQDSKSGNIICAGRSTLN